MNFTKADLASYNLKLKSEISDLQKLSWVIEKKNPVYPELLTAINISTIMMATTCLYLDGKHSYLIPANEDVFQDLQVVMHKVFLNEIQISVECELREIIKKKHFPVINTKNKAEIVVGEISQKLPDAVIFKKEINKILKLGANHITFNDYLDTVLNNTPGLKSKFKTDSRNFFKDGLSILRNKADHSDQHFTEDEKQRLISAGFRKAIRATGLPQMSFESYRLIITQCVMFFDTIYFHL
ncbi:hypothetical protein HYV64_03375 [Candidatus Shapirobacteria bacterium]|nr:hypothetical protein [Candidatus Shapirobacteria bacterium]